MSETPLTGRIRPGAPPPDLAACEKSGGYEALRLAVGKLSPKEVRERVTAARLRGRGGAGFPTGVKWNLVPTGDQARHPTYLLVNADEMEPGSFKDRILLEGDPHLVLEGALLSAFAVGADEVIIFVRWAYKEAVRRLERARAEAIARGYIGRNICGSGSSVNVRIHTSAGRYMCGEETALINALEGRRANPRSKPPFPQTSGLWGCPTVVNNVETVCNVPGIVRRGAEWFRGLSRTGDGGGTKLYGVSGRAARPGCWELPMGTTLRELLEEHAGGMRPGYALRGVLPGGASTDFLTPEHLDTPLDFDALGKVGSRLGTGTLVLLDDRTCPVGFVRNLEQFFARESCGWCTPCRDGLPWTVNALSALEEGRGTSADLEALEMHCRALAPGRTFCAFAPGAMEPLQSALRYFRADFERHIREKRCPWKTP